MPHRVLQGRIIQLSVLIIALSIGYYFFFYLPGRDYQSNIRDCEKEASGLFSDMAHPKTDTQQMLARAGISDIWGDPLFYFNRKLNSCLMYRKETTLAQGQDPFVTEQVFDVYTNKTLILTHYEEHYGQKNLINGLDPQKFDDQAKLLLSQ